MINWKPYAAALAVAAFVFSGGLNNQAVAGAAQNISGLSRVAVNKTETADTAGMIIKANAAAVGKGKKAALKPKKEAKKSQNVELREMVTRYAREYGVPADLAHAVVSIESNYKVNARGSAGEVGLMQIKPSTARGMGYRGSVSGLYNPETNIKFGMKYLAKAHELGGGTTCGAVLKYNAGHYAKRMNPTSSKYCAKVKNMIGK